MISDRDLRELFDRKAEDMEINRGMPPALVRRVSCMERAMPKSRSLATPSLPSAPRQTKMFSGFRSRCTMPCCSAWASPASSPSSTPPACASVIRPMCGRSDPRSTYSIAMYGVPSCSK
jgi:hypothetical protein